MEPVDLSEVERLLSERSAARSARDWNEADTIRDRLGELGVTVQDNDKTWVVSNDYVPRRQQQRFERADQRSRGDLERRIDLNDGRAYTKAEFRSEYGGYREWDMSPPEGGAPRSNGAPSNDWRKERRERDARRMATRSQPYTRAAECTADLDATQLAEIEDLVERRLRKKLDRSFEEADQLLAELESRDVKVSDDARSWRADGLSFVYPYRCNGGPAGRSDSEVRQVEALVHERGVAKSLRDYDKADALGDELYDLGVELDDRARTFWFVYGKGSSARRTGGGGGTHDYQRAHSDDYELSQEKLDQIDALLGKRLAAKKARNFDKADEFQTELRALGVEVDDRARSWYVRYSGGTRSASSFNVRGR